MTSYQIIKIIIAIGLAVGGISFCVNPDLRLGKKFQEGFAMAGQMMLSIAGIMTIAPVLAEILKPVVVPVFRLIGADPACFAIFFGCDMGGYPLAVSLAESQDVSYNYKAAFIDTEKNLIGFKTYGDGEGAVYRIYSYDAEKGFTEVFEAQTNYDDSIRGLYAGNVFYLVDGNTVRSYDMTNFEKIDDIVL